jgi:putative regulator of septum formation
MISPEAPEPEDAGPADAGRPINRWAIAAFLLGLVSLVPLSVIAGIVALVKARDGREAGRGLAIAGMVISMLWAAVWAYSIWPKDGLITGTVQAGPTLRVGDCFGASINSPVSCDKPHHREVFAVLSLSRFPDNDAEQEQLENRCKAELPKFSPSASRDPELGIEAWPPGTESRYMENHAAGCVAYFSSDRVGSIKR